MQVAALQIGWSAVLPRMHSTCWESCGSPGWSSSWSSLPPMVDQAFDELMFEFYQRGPTKSCDTSNKCLMLSVASATVGARRWKKDAPHPASQQHPVHNSTRFTHQEGRNR